MHALECLCALRHDVAASFRSSDKSNCTHIRMLGQGATRYLTEAVHEIPDTGRQPRIMGYLRQQCCCQRAPFGRLVDYSTPGSQGRCNFPGRQHERRVPGGDDPDGSKRFTNRVIQLVNCR